MAKLIKMHQDFLEAIASSGKTWIHCPNIHKTAIFTADQNYLYSGDLGSDKVFHEPIDKSLATMKYCLDQNKLDQAVWY